jgi:hypothetical protein
MNVQMADAGLEVLVRKFPGQLHGSIQDKIWGCFVKLLISELAYRDQKLPPSNDVTIDYRSANAKGEGANGRSDNRANEGDHS